MTVEPCPGESVYHGVQQSLSVCDSCATTVNFLTVSILLVCLWCSVPDA